MKKYLLTICALLLGSLVISQVPDPNYKVIGSNKDAEVVIEAKTLKRDTLTISEEESYLIYTLENIQVFKGELNSKTFTLKIKRDFCEEQGLCQYSHGGTWKPILNYTHVIFLKKGKDGYRSRGTFTYGDPKLPIYEQDVVGLQLYFKSLISFYQFLNKLEGLKVPPSYLDSSRYAKPQEKNAWQDSTFLNMLEKRRAGRLQSQKDFDADMDWKMKKMQSRQKKSNNKRGSTHDLPLANPSLTVSIENPGISYLNTGFTTLDFDVVIKPSSPIYLDNVFLKIKYNKSVFGTKIVSIGTISAKIYPQFVNSTYKNEIASLRDDQTATDQVTVDFGVKPNLSSYSRTLVNGSTKLLRISIIVSNCSLTPNIEAGNLVLAPLLCSYTNNATAGNSDELEFSQVLFNLNLTPNPDLCRPNIKSISPTTITAGTNSKLVIDGFGFGAVQGKGLVVLKNAEDNGQTNIMANDPMDIKWSDNKIEYIVPSYVESVIGDDKPSSGSGKVMIRENSGKVSLEKYDIKIPYSVLNVYSPSDSKKYFVVPVQSDGGNNGKITFYPTKELSANVVFINIIKRAMEDLSCKTTVNFEFSPTSVENSQGYVKKDKFAVISLTDGSIFTDPNTFMATNRQTTEVCIRDGQKWYINNETDIAINKTTKWSVASENQEVVSGEYDFYQAILHELAHAAGIGHVVSQTELMKPFIDMGKVLSKSRFNYNNFPNDYSIEGIKWLLNEGDKYSYSASNCASFYKMTRKGICGITSIEETNNAEFTIKNNPVDDQNLYILPPTNLYGTMLKYDIVNLQGQAIGNGSKIVSSDMEISMNNFSPGMYFVLLNDYEGKKYSFKILKR